MRTKIVILLLGLCVAVPAAARYGYILPNLGSLLNLFFPPDDLWSPLAEAIAKKDVQTYSLKASHRYPGEHTIEISIPRQTGMENQLPGIRLEVEIIGSGITRRSGLVTGSPFWGQKREGVSFYTYNFPKDVNDRNSLTYNIKLDKDINEAIHRFGDVRIAIVKGSDK
jgi:hypothetical protein